MKWKEGCCQGLILLFCYLYGRLMKSVCIMGKIALISGLFSLVSSLVYVPSAAREYGQVHSAGQGGLRSRLAEAVSGKDRRTAAEISLELSSLYLGQDVDSAMFFASEGLKYAERNSLTAASLKNNVAESLFLQGEMDQSIEVRREALDMALQAGADSLTVSDILTSLGISYRRKSMPDSALAIYDRALGYLQGDSPEAKSQKSHLLTTIAVLYSNISRSDEAADYSRQAVELSIEAGDLEEQIYASSSAGAIMVKAGDFEGGASVLRRALFDAIKFNEPKYQLKVLAYMVAMFSITGQTDSLDSYMGMAAEPLAALPPSTPESLGYKETLAMVLSSLHRYGESNDVFSGLLALDSLNSSSPADRICLYMARNYMKMHEYENAADFYERSYAIADSVYNSEVVEQLSEWSVKYETQKKELEISLLRQQQLEERAQKMRWIVSTVAVLLLLAGAVMYFTLRRKREKREEELRLAQRYIDGLEKERTRLASDLHDGVCNDLLGVGYQIQSMDIPENYRNMLLGMTEELRSDVRYISHELMPPKFKFASLDETLESYTRKLEGRKGIHVRFTSTVVSGAWSDVPESVSYEIYRIVQEMVSNIIMHSGATAVDICITLSDQSIVLKISDDGHAFDLRNTGGKGIGWNVISERMKTLGAEMESRVEEGAQSFVLRVPVDLRKEV